MKRLLAELARLYRFATTDPDLTHAEAKSLEPGRTAADTRAIDVWNRAARLRAANEEVRALRAERDAALAVAFYAGKSLMGLPEEDVYRMVGAAFRAWLLPDHKFPGHVARPNIDRIRREAGLEP